MKYRREFQYMISERIAAAKTYTAESRSFDVMWQHQQWLALAKRFDNNCQHFLHIKIYVFKYMYVGFLLYAMTHSKTSLRDIVFFMVFT